MMIRPSTIALLVAGSIALSSSGCAIVQPVAQPRALPSEFQLGRLSERTAFETSSTEPRANDDLAPVGSGPNGDEFGGNDDSGPSEDQKQRQRRSAFIAGVILASVGTVGTVAFAAAGQATQNKLSDGYDTSLSRGEESDIKDRGAVFNGVAIGSAAVGVVGLSIAMIALGIDYNNCGKIVKKRHKECN